MGNDTYVDLIKTALTYQVGDDYNYVPLNQTTTEGNDDQAFWDIAVMAAAEKTFPTPRTQIGVAHVGQGGVQHHELAVGLR